MTDVWGWAELYEPEVDLPYYFAINSPLMSTTGPNTATSVILQMNNTGSTVDSLNPGQNRAVRSVGRLGSGFSGADFLGHRVYLWCWGRRKRQILASRSANFTTVPGDNESGLIIYDSSDDDPLEWDAIEATAFDTRVQGFTSGIYEVRFIPPQGDTYSFLTQATGFAGQHIVVVDAGAAAIQSRVLYGDWESGTGGIVSYAYSNDGQWLAIHCSGSVNAVSIIERATNTRVAHITSPTVSHSGHQYFSFSDDSYYFYFVAVGGSPSGTWVYRTSDWLPDVIVPSFTFSNGQVIRFGLLSPDNQWMYDGYSSFFLDSSNDQLKDIWEGTTINGPTGGNSQHAPNANNADWTMTGGFLVTEDSGTDVSGSFRSLRMSNLNVESGGGDYVRPRWRPFQ